MISSALPLIKRLAEQSGLLSIQVAMIAQTAPLRYKTFQIRKKNGGMRTVAQPAREVKVLQSILRELISAHLPVHECVAAYRPGDSIVKNASRHARSEYLLKMDVVNFFPSITERDVAMHFERHLGNDLSADEIDAAVHICCWSEGRVRPLKLCIGAPASPWISNSILFDIDSAIEKSMVPLGVTYSRYADDMTFSCNRKGVLKVVPSVVSEILEAADYPRLSVNDRKTIHASRACNRTVTGVVITPQGKLSVGREMKRRVRAMHHRMRLGLLNEDEAEVLAGLLSFIESVEPGFRVKLIGQ